jgi:hypothetical protein
MKKEDNEKMLDAIKKSPKEVIINREFITSPAQLNSITENLKDHNT